MAHLQKINVHRLSKQLAMKTISLRHKYVKSVSKMFVVSRVV